MVEEMQHHVHPARSRSCSAARCARAARGRSTRRNAGFTLIEASLTTVIIGVAVLSIVEAQQAYQAKNAIATRVGTAMQLTNEIRELMANLPLLDPQTPNDQAGLDFDEDEAMPSTWDDLDDFVGSVSATGEPTPRVFDAATTGGPINAIGFPVPELRQFSQQVEVQPVDDFNLRFANNFDVLGDEPRNPLVYRIRVVVAFQQDPDDPQQTPTTLTDTSWIATRQF